MWKHVHVGNHDKDYHDAYLTSNELSAAKRESLSQIIDD